MRFLRQQLGLLGRPETLKALSDYVGALTRLGFLALIIRVTWNAPDPTGSALNKMLMNQGRFGALFFLSGLFIAFLVSLFLNTMRFVQGEEFGIDVEHRRSIFIRLALKAAVMIGLLMNISAINFVFYMIVTANWGD